MADAFKYFTDDIEHLSENHVKKLDGAPCWIRIVNPTVEKLQILSKLTGVSVHELRVDVEYGERPKYELKPEFLQITYKTPHMQEEQLVTVALHIFIVKNTIISVEKTPTKIFNDLFATLQENSDKNFSKRPVGSFISFVLDKVNDEFLVRVEDIAEKLESYEKDLKFEKKDLEMLYNYSISLTYFNQALVANLEVLNSLKKSSFSSFNADDMKDFQDLYYEALHVLDTQKIQRDIIGTLLKLQDNITQGNLNAFIKRLTAITVILMVPTLITGIYGMNFQYIPLSSHPWGFYITIGIGIVIVTLILVWMFAKAKWF